MIKFVAKYASISAIVMIILDGFFSARNNMRLYGYGKEDPLLISIIMGLVGTLISLLGWAIDNYRYTQIKKKNESKISE